MTREEMYCELINYVSGDYLDTLTDAVISGNRRPFLLLLKIIKNFLINVGQN